MRPNNGCSAGAPNKRVLPQTVPKRVPRSSRVPCSSRQPRAVFHGPGARCSARDAHGRPGKGGSHLAWPRGRLSGVAAGRELLPAAGAASRDDRRCGSWRCSHGRASTRRPTGPAWRAASARISRRSRAARSTRASRLCLGRSTCVPFRSATCVPVIFARACIVFLLVSFGLSYVRTLLDVS